MVQVPVGPTHPFAGAHRGGRTHTHTHTPTIGRGFAFSGGEALCPEDPRKPWRNGWRWLANVGHVFSLEAEPVSGGMEFGNVLNTIHELY